jgi:hypothetical protein
MTLQVPEYLQTETYDARDDRRVAFDMPIQPGVVGSGDLAVAQRGAGANMSVDVAVGMAFVQGTTQSRQGMYHVFNSATENVVVGAAHSTLPRLDQIILRIFDSTVSGASDTPTLSTLAGTATSGATLDNRSGAATLPDDSIRLADVLVPAGASSIVTADIRARRQRARGQFVTASPSTSGPTISTVAFGAVIPQLTITAEFSGKPVRITSDVQFHVQSGYGLTGSTNAIMQIYATHDGTAITGSGRTNQWAGGDAANLDDEKFPLSLDLVHTPTAGRHTYAIMGYTSMTTAIAQQVERSLVIEELIR